jgi:glycosyltransferase involved in cell wall biosynthesis
MKILHYSLGLPPMRSGGLTLYAKGLIEEQSKDNKVFHLYPGNVDLFNKKTRIVRKDIESSNIFHFELVNSLPLPLFRGIKEPKDFMLSVSIDTYKDFFNKVKPDVIHIHTLMGLHKEFFEAAKDLGIRKVYTTHDYFGICPTINLYKDTNKSICTDFNSGKGCAECSMNAMGTKALMLTQTPIYPFIKKVKKFKRKSNKISSNISIKSAEGIVDEGTGKEYSALREFYFSMLKMVDYFHFNSTLTENLFKEYLPSIKGEVVSITHNGIRQVHVEKTKSSKIRVGYFGPFKEYKGFFFLLDSFKDLPKDQYELHLYGDVAQLDIPSNVYQHGRFVSSELSDILKTIDVLVIPSLWKETFGFVVLEALSFGTPVIISDNVGSADLVDDDFGVIFKPTTTMDLTTLLKSLDKDTLQQMSVSITKKFKLVDIKGHNTDIQTKIYSSNQ